MPSNMSRVVCGDAGVTRSVTSPSSRVTGPGSRPASRGWPWWGAVNETWVKNGVVDAAWPRIISEAMLP